MVSKAKKRPRTSSDDYTLYRVKVSKFFIYHAPRRILGKSQMGSKLFNRNSCSAIQKRFSRSFSTSAKGESTENEGWGSMVREKILQKMMGMKLEYDLNNVLLEFDSTNNYDMKTGNCINDADIDITDTSDMCLRVGS